MILVARSWPELLLAPRRLGVVVDPPELDVSAAQLVGGAYRATVTLFCAIITVASAIGFGQRVLHVPQGPMAIRRLHEIFKSGPYDLTQPSFDPIVDTAELCQLFQGFSDNRDLMSLLENFAIYSPDRARPTWETSYAYSYWTWHWAGAFMANQTRPYGEQAFFTLYRLLSSLAFEKRGNEKSSAYSEEARVSFMHGATWHIVATEAWAHDDARRFADKLCSDLLEDSPQARDVFYDCWHGVGHGLFHRETLHLLPVAYSTTKQLRVQSFDAGKASVDGALSRCMVALNMSLHELGRTREELNMTRNEFWRRSIPIKGCVAGVWHSYFNYLPQTFSPWEAHCTPYPHETLAAACRTFAFQFGKVPGMPITLSTYQMQMRFMNWGAGPSSFICDVAHWLKTNLTRDYCRDYSSDAGLTKYAVLTKLASDLEERMPMVGLGTCCWQGGHGEALVATIREHLLWGGRLIDTAQEFGNRAEVGIAIGGSRLPRDYVWLTDKIKFSPSARCSVSDAEQGRLLACDQAVRQRDEALRAVGESLVQLNTTYVDLMLMQHHDDQTADERVAVWRGLIDAKTQGLVHHIGVSDFHRQEEIDALTTATGVRPSVNQLEFHPWVRDETRELVRWCQRVGIRVAAYNCLRGLDEPGVAQVASKLGVNRTDVLLRWAMQQGVAVIPSASSLAQIRSNLQVADVKLSPVDVEVLERRRKTY